MKEKDTNQICKEEFKEKDFIILNTIDANERASYHLVIHCESLFILMMKKMYNPESNKKYEIEFGEKYSHRCFVPFYGFLKKDNQIVVFVYEYMSKFVCHIKLFVKKIWIRKDP